MAKDIEGLKKELMAIINKAVTKEVNTLFASKIAETIYKRTKSGKGLSQDTQEYGAASLVPIKPLSQKYIEYRKTKILGPFASARKSNLTFSGELLESIIVRIGAQSIFVEIDNANHSSGQNLQEIADAVAKKGRPFFGISTTEAKTLDNFIRRIIRDRVRQLQK
jgi:hypothetical protein